MLENIELLCHSSIKIKREKVIYIDPFKIDKNYNDADIIFITHDHYDHYSEEDIEKIRKEDTIIIVPKAMFEKVLKNGFNKENIIEVIPNRKYKVENKKVECDIALVPVGGTYTMNFKEAAELVNEIKPKIAVPTHYGSVVGKKEDAINFIKLLSAEIEGKILMK